MLLAGSLCFPGCAAESDRPSTGVQRHLRLVGNEYGAFLSRNGGVPPRDEQQLREFLQSRMDRLSKLGVGELDELLTSPRDGEPLVLITGVDRPLISPYGYPWAAHESVGVGGKRLAVSVRGTVVDLTPAEIEEMFQGPAP